MVAVITIGRNIGNVPMSAHRWLKFRIDLHKVLKDFEAKILFHCDGMGIWEETQEDAYTVILRADPDRIWRYGYLRQALSHLAREYKQDAIALTFGETDLITG